MGQKKITRREKMLQWGIIALFLSMTLFAGSTQIASTFWNGLTILIGVTMFLSGIWELKNYYKKEKLNK